VVVFDAADVLEKQGEAGGSGIFSHDGKTGRTFGIRFGGGSGATFDRRVEFAELLEKTEGAFGGGSVAQAEIVFFDLIGGQLKDGNLGEGHNRRPERF
jgi:hypothetical protein